MDLHLAGKIALVTGASKGIGLAITHALKAEGIRVIAASRHPVEGVDSVQVDLSDPAGADRLAEAASGGLDILVNNVGAVTPRTGGFLSVTDEDWIATLTINFLAAVRVTRAVLPYLADGGAIVTVSSVNATLPDPLVIDYSAAKAALSSFCKSLSKELGPRGIRVNTVSPGPVATDLWLGESGVAETIARSGALDPSAVAKRAASESVTGRFTEPSEVADLVLLLASLRTGNVTGADFIIDGGLITTL